MTTVKILNRTNFTCTQGVFTGNITTISTNIYPNNCVITRNEGTSVVWFIDGLIVSGPIINQIEAAYKLELQKQTTESKVVKSRSRLYLKSKNQ